MSLVKGEKSLFWYTGLDTKGLDQGSKRAKGILRDLAAKISKMDIFAVLSVGALYHFRKIAKEATALATRFETLGVVLRVVGNNAGYTGDEMEELAQDLEKTGISMIQARQNVIRMAQAQLDLTKASELARVSQDAAVIGAVNSSEAFERVVHGITTGMPRVLRQIGIIVDFQHAYEEAAEAVGQSAEDFTMMEKTQIRMNTVLEAGTRIAGSYEAAMSTAGKQALSMERYLEDLKVTLGTLTLPLYTEGIKQLTGGIKGIDKALDQERLQDYGDAIALIFVDVEAQVLRLLMRFNKFNQIMIDTVRNFALVYSLGEKLPIPFMPSKFTELADRMKDKGQGSNEEYAELERMLLNLAKRRIEIEAAATPEARRLAKEKIEAAEAVLLAAQKKAKVEQDARDAEEASAKKIPRFIRPVSSYYSATGAGQGGIGKFGGQGDGQFGMLSKGDAFQNQAQKMLNEEKTVSGGATQEDRDRWEKDAVAANKKMLEGLLKDTRKFSKKELEIYAAKILTQSKLYAENDATKKILLEEYRATMEKVFEYEITRLQEMSGAIHGLAGFIGEFDQNLAGMVSTVGELTDGVQQVMTSSTGFGEAGGLISIAKSVNGWAKNLSEYLVKVDEIDRTSPFATEWAGWNSFNIAQKKYQILISEGDEKLKFMNRLLQTYTEIGGDSFGTGAEYFDWQTRIWHLQQDIKSMEDGGGAQSRLTGAVGGITEHTAGLLAGQVNAILMNTVQSKEILAAMITDRIDPMLNAMREVRDNTYWNDDIYKKSININEHLSVMMQTGLDNLNANQETARNTRYLRYMDMKLQMLNDNVRAIGL